MQSVNIKGQKTKLGSLFKSLYKSCLGKVQLLRINDKENIKGNEECSEIFELKKPTCH